MTINTGQRERHIEIEMRSMEDERTILQNIEDGYARFLVKYEQGHFAEDDEIIFWISGDNVTFKLDQVLKMSPAAILEFYKDSTVEYIQEYRETLKEGDKVEKHVLH